MFAFFESPVQLFIIGMIALLLFGNRVPEVMRSLGRGLSEFKKGLTTVEDDIRRVGDSRPPA